MIGDAGLRLAQAEEALLLIERRRDLEASIVGRRRLDSALPVRRANAGRGFKSENALGCDDPIKAARKGRPGFLEFKLTFASFAADTDRQPGVEVNRSFDQISPTCSAAELQPHMAVFLAFARGESDLGISRFVQSRDEKSCRVVVPHKTNSVNTTHLKGRTSK